MMLVKMIEDRDRRAVDIPNLPPEIWAEAITVFKELDQQIELIEQKMAEEYEEFQNEKRAEEELAGKFAEAEIAHERLYIIVKHTSPQHFEEFHAISIENLTPEEEQDFYDRIARREADEPDELLSESEGEN